MTTACPSARFVCDDRSTLVENLAALWARDPLLAAAVDEATMRPRSLRKSTVSPAKNGQPTLAAQTADGRTLQLHSRYDPAGEAATLIDRTGPVDGVAYFVLGFGLGYHVEELFRRAPTTARIWILEPDVEVIASALESRDLAELLNNPRVAFITEIDRAALLAKFQSLAALLMSGTTTIEHAPSVERTPEFFAAARAWIDEIASFSRTAIHTLVLNSTKTIGNIARNLPWYARSPGIARLHNAFRRQPAIIVSAGPSLRKNRHLLLEAKGKAVIIAVQTTLRPLLDLGVEPDFVTSLDYSEISARFFHDLPRGLKTELIAEPKATDAIFGLHPGPMSLVGSDVADDLLHGATSQRPRLKSGATVAHLSFYLAEYLGCDPIVFVGQDLGFSDGLCYAAGTSYDDVWRPELNRFHTVEMKQWEQIARERSILRRIPDHLGRPMYTEQRLFSYLQQFERDFAACKSRVIDASEGGAMKRGATSMPLADVLRRFANQPLRSTLPPHAGPPDVSIDRVLAALNARVEEAGRMRDVACRVVPLLEDVRDHVDDDARVNRAVAQIDPLRAEMNAVGRTYQLVMYLAQQNEFERFKTDLSIDGREATAPAAVTQRRRADRDLTNARAIVTAADAFIALVRETIARFAVPEAA